MVVSDFYNIKFSVFSVKVKTPVKPYDYEVYHNREYEILT